MGTYIKKIVVALLIVYSCKPQLVEIQSKRQQWCVDNKHLVGINYHFTIKTSVNYSLLTLDSIFIHGKWIKKFSYSTLGQSIYDTTFKKGDTILITINMLDTTQAKQTIKLYYSFKNKQKCLIFKNIKELKNLCY